MVGPELEGPELDDNDEVQTWCRLHSTSAQALGYLRYFIDFPTRGNVTYVSNALLICLGEYSEGFKQLKPSIDLYKKIKTLNISFKENLLHDILHSISIDIKTIVPNI